MPCSPAQGETIRAAFSALPELFRGFGDDKERLYRMCLEDERQHRTGHPAPRGFSAGLAARYFAVKWLREYTLQPERLPKLTDYLRIRESAFFAAAVSVEHAALVRPWVASVGPEFDALDYVELMRIGFDNIEVEHE